MQGWVVKWEWSRDIRSGSKAWLLMRSQQPILLILILVKKFPSSLPQLSLSTWFGKYTSPWNIVTLINRMRLYFWNRLYWQFQCLGTKTVFLWINGPIKRWEPQAGPDVGQKREIRQKVVWPQGSEVEMYKTILSNWHVLLSMSYMRHIICLEGNPPPLSHIFKSSKVLLFCNNLTVAGLHGLTKRWIVHNACCKMCFKSEVSFAEFCVKVGCSVCTVHCAVKCSVWKCRFICESIVFSARV